MKKISFILLLFSFSTQLAANKILVASFKSLDSKSEPALEKIILSEFTKEFASIGYESSTIDADLNQNLEFAVKNNYTLYITGYYSRSDYGNVNLYSQVYDPQKKVIIDAISFTLNLDVLKKIPLDKSEMNRPDEEVVKELVRQTAIQIELNQGKKEQRQNIEEHLISKPAFKAGEFILSKSDTKAEARKVFELLEEQTEAISIVSKKVGEVESVSKTSAIVSVYGRQKIVDTGARNLVDILKQVPGVEVFYDQFGFYKVAFRGIRSRSGVLMLLDGHRINNIYDGSTFLDIRADAIEKVEVIRGPGSSLHGTNAFVGVINVITRNSESKNITGGSMSTRIGAQNTLEPSAYYNLNLSKNWNLNTYVGHYESKRSQVHLNHDSSCTVARFGGSGCDTTLIPLPYASYISTNDRKKQSNVFIGIKNGDSFFMNGKMIQEVRGPNVGELGIVTPESEIGFRLFTGDIGTKKIEITDKLSFSAKIYTDTYLRNDLIQVERSDFKSHALSSAIKQTGYRYDTKGSEIIFQYNTSERFTLMLGFQYEALKFGNFYSKQNYVRDNTSQLLPIVYDYDNLNSGLNDTLVQYYLTSKASIPDPTVLTNNKTKTRTIQAGFVQALLNPTDWLSITLGVRYDKYSDFGKTINPKSGIVITPFNNDKFGSLSFKILFGTAFRAPSFQELYDKSQAYQAGGVYGNQTQFSSQSFGRYGLEPLKPETLQTAEFGIDYLTPYKPLNLQINAFSTRILNNIEATNISGTLPSTTDIYKNLRGLSSLGAEIEARLAYSSRNYGFANASWFQMIDYGNLQTQTNEDYKTFRVNVPQARANLGVNLAITKFFTLNNTVWVSSERSSNTRFTFEKISTRGFKYPQYHIWNLSLASTEDLIRNLEVRINIFNLQNYKLYDESNSATVDYHNRAIPAMYAYGRYIEWKLTYYLK